MKGWTEEERMEMEIEDGEFGDLTWRWGWGSMSGFIHQEHHVVIHTGVIV
jgi:hypothetical protein